MSGGYRRRVCCGHTIWRFRDSSYTQPVSLVVSGCLGRKLKSQPWSACGISRGRGGRSGVRGSALRRPGGGRVHRAGRGGGCGALCPTGGYGRTCGTHGPEPERDDELERRSCCNFVLGDASLPPIAARPAATARRLPPFFGSVIEATRHRHSHRFFTELSPDFGDSPIQHLVSGRRQVIIALESRRRAKPNQS